MSFLQSIAVSLVRPTAVLLALFLSLQLFMGLQAKPSNAAQKLAKQAQSAWDNSLDGTEQALSLLDKAILLAPDEASFYRTKAAWLQDLNRRSEALIAIRKAVALSPNDGYAQMILSELLLEQGSLQESYQVASRANQLLKVEPASYLLKAKVAERLGLLKDAEATMSDGLNRYPTWIDLLLTRADLRYKLKEYKGVLQDTEKILKIVSVIHYNSRRKAIMLRIDSFKALGDKAAVKREYLWSLEADLNYRQVISDACLFFAKEGDSRSLAKAKKALSEFDLYYNK
ncbi:MAG: hypothetical protein K2Y32_18360 [Candidatus Obscuribacterales bacterium]|nr:hypothetical protein [Candidatus Obscuribacterales bacterium]